jgi:hypothetical protein
MLQAAVTRRDRDGDPGSTGGAPGEWRSEHRVNTVTGRVEGDPRAWNIVLIVVK